MANKRGAADRIKALLPTREQMEGNRWLRPVAHLLLRPALWRFTRRSVPRAVGVGLFVGIFVMVPFAQPLAAALIAIPCRANVPLCAGTTLLSNPLTTPLIILAALWVGSALFGMHGEPTTMVAMMRQGVPFEEWTKWLLSSAAPALMSGLLTIAAVAGLLGWAIATFGWRLWIGHKWRAREHRLGRA